MIDQNIIINEPVSFDYKFTIVGIQIGNNLEYVEKKLSNQGVRYEDAGSYYDVYNAVVVFGERFRLYVNHDFNEVTGFVLQKNNELPTVTGVRTDVGGYWHVLAAIDRLFKKWKYCFIECKKERIEQIYAGFYEQAEVYHTREETIIDIRRYDFKKKRSWWFNFWK